MNLYAFHIRNENMARVDAHLRKLRGFVLGRRVNLDLFHGLLDHFTNELRHSLYSTTGFRPACR